MGADSELSFDYTVVDSRGIRGVKDGKEFPITEEEYRRKNPYHKDIGCTECSFVQDKETLLLWVISREAKEKATSKPSFIGKFTMPDWTGHNNFYIFKCERCNRVSVDYRYGASLSCGCGCTVLLKWIERRKILKREFPDSNFEDGEPIVNKWKVGLVLLALWTLVIFIITQTNWRPF